MRPLPLPASAQTLQKVTCDVFALSLISPSVNARRLVSDTAYEQAGQLLTAIGGTVAATDVPPLGSVGGVQPKAVAALLMPSDQLSTS